jgi:hypothetical protein
MATCSVTVAVGLFVQCAVCAVRGVVIYRGLWPIIYVPPLYFRTDECGVFCFVPSAV